MLSLSNDEVKLCTSKQGWQYAYGKIHEIEAMGFVMPYNSKTGWE